MNVIKLKTLAAFWEAKTNREMNARDPLLDWFKVCRKQNWANVAEIRRTYGHADPVKVRSGKTAIVFNVAGNKVRVITLIDFDRKTMLVTHVLTHKDYDEARWKGDL